LKLIEGARQWWRMWSQRINALGLLILSYIAIDPVSVLVVWNMMPPEVRARAPVTLVASIGAILFGLSMLARMVRQPKLEKSDGG
jgi:hypothetical protein